MCIKDLIILGKYLEKVSAGLKTLGKSRQANLMNGTTKSQNFSRLISLAN